MGHEHIKFFETARIEQKFEPFPRGQLALAVLAINTALPPAEARLRPSVLQLIEYIAQGNPRKHST